MAKKFSLAKSLILMRQMGYMEGKTEIPPSMWNPHGKDLFGFLDAIGMKKGFPLLGINGCGEDIHSHIEKWLVGYTDNKGVFHGPNEGLKLWLELGHTFFLWAWRKRGAAGKRKLWQMKEYEFVIKNGVVVCQETVV
jgi:hypothetical protein